MLKNIRNGPGPSGELVYSVCEMPTKKKVTGRYSREVASPRCLRQQKRLVQNVQIQTKKVTELITSSARKKKVGKLH